ncbi:MAG TPA: hypothetical protein PKK60_01110 [archaeon]|nr:hypothetical protein [archaeon]
MLQEEKAQVSFEYLLTAVFVISLAISTALIVETLRQLALEAQAEILTIRTQTIEQIMQK